MGNKLPVSESIYIFVPCHLTTASRWHCPPTLHRATWLSSVLGACKPCAALQAWLLDPLHVTHAPVGVGWLTAEVPGKPWAGQQHGTAAIQAESCHCSHLPTGTGTGVRQGRGRIVLYFIMTLRFENFSCSSCSKLTNLYHSFLIYNFIRSLF